MTDRRRIYIDAHHNRGWRLAEQVLDRFNAHGEYQTIEDVRQAIEALADTTELQVTIADMWLNLGKDQSQLRRKQQPPVNPFKKSGKELIGIKGAIRAWDLSWLEIEHLQEGRKIYGRAGTWAARAKAAEMAQRVAVLTTSTRGEPLIVGFVNTMSPIALNQTIQRSDRLQVAFVTLDEALVRSWWIKSDQMALIDAYIATIQEVRTEVQDREEIPRS